MVSNAAAKARLDARGAAVGEGKAVLGADGGVVGWMCTKKECVQRLAV